MGQAELDRERARVKRVQKLLLAIIAQSRNHADFQDQTIRTMLTDAWEELRMRPTALSQWELDQMDTEINRFITRRDFSKQRASQYERMLCAPFFARIDYREEAEVPHGQESAQSMQEPIEEILIGLFSLKDERGNLIVYDWRAPVCSLYYDALPGHVRYMSPSGEIRGMLYKKRQYSIKDGQLQFYVDTDYSIDDEMLLNILSGATSKHMKQIVSTIQAEQNAAIRYERAPVLSIVGGAGSGKTSVAMHRAAYLMYRHRDTLDASRIAILSPSNAFSEYISTVLPELGEDNIRATTLHAIVSGLIGRPVETVLAQYARLIAPEETLRRKSVAFKSDEAFVARVREFIDRFSTRGPRFADIALGKHTLIARVEMEYMYRERFRSLNPAQRLERISVIVEKRLEEWEGSFYTQYRNQLIENHRGKDLEFYTRMAVAQRLHPLRGEVKRVLTVDPSALFADMMRDSPRSLAKAARENAEAGLIWWEDAPVIAYMLIALGFAKNDPSIKHLLVDEAQDYAAISFALMRAYYPKAECTLLGDPNQRTLPGLSACEPSMWARVMGYPEAPLVTLTRGYRSTLEIIDFCSTFLGEEERARVPSAFGRSGSPPKRSPFSLDALKGCLSAWQAAGHQRIAVIARSPDMASALEARMSGLNVLTGDEDDLEEDPAHRPMLASLPLVKGMEFDAVAVVWSAQVDQEGEGRRIYTACSRALHELVLFEVPAEENG